MGVILFINSAVIFGLSISVIGFYLIIIEVKRLFITGPQIVINKLGIKTYKTVFYRWDEIIDERVSGEFVGKGARPCFEYKHPAGKVKMKVEPLNIRPQDLDVLLKFYRKPWEFKIN